ncbi:YihY/virulence factor BrkB family protein [Rhizobium sp. 'Codium 1']|uniref:YihY/virulence factor BrkB family protein n=1 Tax=Rhizobium sp. 'Codium 1' TaxID=2940484 RepID=UPI001E569497|nr:YihY/virulence factor BrkB family protein [Rhizobium sp. 'Codium 1']MCC8931816.1 YihY/virulence factor BrkB family protein [Rhizobium sp. 'Codium 1']
MPPVTPSSPHVATTPVADERGRHAQSPETIPLRGLWDVSLRLMARLTSDRVMLAAAGVSFYMMLSLFPGLAALVSLYGLIADPTTIAGRLDFLSELLPADGVAMILDQLQSLADENDSTLSIGFLAGLGVSLFSARNGMVALFEAMNIAYKETEKRGFIHTTFLAIAFTLGAMAILAVIVTVLAILPMIISVVLISERAEMLVGLIRWPILMSVVWLGTVMVYRYGPSRENAKLRWLAWGTLLSSLAWLVMSIGFSFYLENFADFNATYGTLGTFIGLMFWTWLSVVILVVGAMMNAELEHQTAEDTTTGPTQPMGLRGAHVADTLGPSQ